MAAFIKCFDPKCVHFANIIPYQYVGWQNPNAVMTILLSVTLLTVCWYRPLSARSLFALWCLSWICLDVGMWSWSERRNAVWNAALLFCLFDFVSRFLCSTFLVSYLVSSLLFLFPPSHSLHPCLLTLSPLLSLSFPPQSSPLLPVSLSIFHAQPMTFLLLQKRLKLSRLW